MKNRFCLVIFMLLLSLIYTSCESIDSKDIQGYKDSIVVNINNDNINIDSISGIEKFQKEWIKITQTDTGRIVLNPCDAMNQSIIIEKRDSLYFLIYEWGLEQSEHKITSFLSKGHNKYEIGAYFGDEYFRFNISVIDSDDFISEWKWNWRVAFDNKRDYYSNIFIPKENIQNFNIVNQPCLDCWGPDICVDYIKKYIDKPFEDLLNDTNFQARISMLFQGDYINFFDKFDVNEKLKLVDDRYFILQANIKDGGEPIEKIFVIDFEKRILGAAYTKNGKYIGAICEVNKDLYPKPLTMWISDRK